MTGWPLTLLEEGPAGLREQLLRLAAGGTESAAGVFPAVNIYDDGERFLVRAEIAGMDKDRLDISVRGDQLTIRGERTLEAADERASYHRREREGGQFRRVVTLPAAVHADAVSATYRNGVLEVELPRVPEAQPRKVRIS